MYGMIHRALIDYVRTYHGEGMVERVKASAQCSEETLITMQVYPDAMTYGLVGAAATVLQQPVEQLLQQFGRHWIGFARDNGFAELMGGPGTDLTGFLSGLDALHARIGLSFPDSQPPSFRTVRTSPNELRLHYYSQRPGLRPFVVGLLEGLAEHLGHRFTITTVASRDAGADHDEFRLGWSGT